MVCYEDSDIAREALKLAQEYANAWRVAIDVVSTAQFVILNAPYPVITVNGLKH